jgi:D-amino peptidase
MLRRGASRAVSNLKEMHPPVFTRPVSLEVTFLVADMAEMALWVRGVERVGPRTIMISSEDLLDLYRMFVTVVRLTRSLVDR